MTVELELQAPMFLIAVPQLADSNFSQTVILLLEHHEEGSMGIVINRPTDLAVHEFCSSQDMVFHGDGQDTVLNGGPVQPERAFLVHQSAHEGPETQCIKGDTRFSYSLETLEMVSASPPEKLRVYLGYASWGPDQLAEEITAGAWLLSTICDDLIFDIPREQIWDATLRRMGIESIQLMHSGELH